MKHRWINCLIADAINESTREWSRFFSITVADATSTAPNSDNHFSNAFAFGYSIQLSTTPRKQITMNHLDYITIEFDAEFAKIPDLKWDPAVGKNYRQTRMMIMGTHTSWQGQDDNRETTRQIVFAENWQDDSFVGFSTTAKMFLDEAGIEYNEQNRHLFWSSVAFNNFLQSAVSDYLEYDEKEVADMAPASASAYFATTEVLEPDLVIFWSNNLEKYQLAGERFGEYPKIGGKTPRVALENPPIVGIYHPSMPFSPPEWMNFLKTCEHSKPHIERFLAYLKETASR